MSKEEEAALGRIHQDYSYNDLLSWRKLANAAVTVDKNVPIEQKMASFFNSWLTPKVNFSGEAVIS